MGKMKNVKQTEFSHPIILNENYLSALYVVSDSVQCSGMDWKGMEWSSLVCNVICDDRYSIQARVLSLTIRQYHQLLL